MFRRFEEIEAWQKGCQLVTKIYDLTNHELLTKDWGLRDQLRRSAISIPSNIAEGYERNSRMEFRRFLLIAKGSCGELRTQLYLVKAVHLALAGEVGPLIEECLEISAMLQNLYSRTKTKQPKQ